MTRVFDQQSAIAPLITPNGLRVGGGVRQASGLWQPAMVDPATGECVWQGAGAFSAAFGIWSPRFATRRNAVFVFNEGWLGCFDAATGAQRWKVPLGGDLSQSSRRWLRDGATDDLTIDVLTTPEGSAAIVRNGDGLVLAFDMRSGELLWSARPDSGRYSVVPEVGVLVLLEDACGELRGVRGDVQWTHTMESATVSGRHIFAKVEGDPDALVCLEGATGQERWRVEQDCVDHIDEAAAGLGQALVAVNGSYSQRAWSVSADAPPSPAGFFARLFGRTYGTPLPVKKAVFLSTTRVGSRVFMVTDSPTGKHVITLDAGNGQPVCTPVSLGDFNWVHIRGQGELAVARCEKDDHISLKAFGPKGGLLWSRDLEDAREHFCSGADVVVELFGQIAVLDASDGSTRLAYTN